MLNIKSCIQQASFAIQTDQFWGKNMGVLNVHAHGEIKNGTVDYNSAQG